MTASGEMGVGVAVGSEAAAGVGLGASVEVAGVKGVRVAVGKSAVAIGVADGVGTDVVGGLGSGPVQARTKASTAEPMSRTIFEVIADRIASACV